MDEHTEEKKAALEKLDELAQEIDEFKKIKKDNSGKTQGDTEVTTTKNTSKEVQEDTEVTVPNNEVKEPSPTENTTAVPSVDKIQDNTLTTDKQPTSVDTNAPQRMSIEGMLDKTLNDFSTEEVQKDYAYVAPIVLTATVPADTVFLTILLGTEIQSPRDEPMTIEVKVDNTGISIVFTPYLFIDGILNARMFSIYFNFSTGEAEVDAKGLLGKVKSTVEKEIQKLVQDTILDQDAVDSKFPYKPFEDEDLKGTLAILQKQIMAKFTPKAGEDTKNETDKPQTPLPPLEAITLSAGMVFKEDFLYELGIAQATIPTGRSLMAKIKLEGNLNHLDTIKVPYIGIFSEGIHVVIDGKLEIVIRKITLRYGGEISLDEVEIKSNDAKGKRLADALDVVLEELILPIANEKIKTTVTKLIEDKVDAMLVGRGINAKKALGLV